MSWAVVTGASGGIGLELVRNLADREPNIHFLLIARREEELKKLVAELKEKKIRAEYMVLDLTKADAPKKLRIGFVLRDMPFDISSTTRASVGGDASMSSLCKTSMR